MTRIMETVDVSVKPRRVCDYMWDLSNLPNYMPVSDVEVVESEAQRAEVHCTLDIDGETSRIVSEEEIVEPGRRVRFRTKEGMHMDATWLLQEIQGGTKVTYVLNYDPPKGALAFLRRSKLQKAMERICSECLQRLRASVEA